MCCKYMLKTKHPEKQMHRASNNHLARPQRKKNQAEIGPVMAGPTSRKNNSFKTKFVLSDNELGYARLEVIYIYIYKLSGGAYAINGITVGMRKHSGGQ